MELPFFFLFWLSHCISCSPGQESDLSGSCDQHCNWGNARPLIHYAGSKIEPATRAPKMPPVPLCHSRMFPPWDSWIKSLRWAFNKPIPLIPQLRTRGGGAAPAIQTSSQTRPAEITTPHAHLLPPKDPEEMGILSRGPSPHSGRSLSLSLLWLCLNP